ncbi:hypothetical protein M758_4G140000, partial [Ceratodon purpureus]
VNPAIWSDLPEELLQRVFARLPLADIIRLRCLSKQWNRILNSHDFKQVCTDTHPKMFAIITPLSYSVSRSFNVRLYDLRPPNYEMQIDTGSKRPNNYLTKSASDGGLVCFACTADEEDLACIASASVIVLVCNPLTRVVRELPLHSHCKRPPEMLHLVMDRVSKCYQVLIVSTDPNGGGLVAEVFHSNTGAWTSANLAEKRYFPGFRDLFLREFITDYHGRPCVYDCAKGYHLEIPANVADLLRDGNYVGMNQCALVQGRVFALCREEPSANEGGRLDCGVEWFFAEFQYLESGVRWLKVKDHRSTDSVRFPQVTTLYLRDLFACKGFLLVVAKFYADSIRHEQWSYDLSTGKWHQIFPWYKLDTCWRRDLMCELQWDVVP